MVSLETLVPTSYCLWPVAYCVLSAAHCPSPQQVIQTYARDYLCLRWTCWLTRNNTWKVHFDICWTTCAYSGGMQFKSNRSISSAWMKTNALQQSGNWIISSLMFTNTLVWRRQYRTYLFLCRLCSCSGSVMRWHQSHAPHIKLEEVYITYC